MSPHSSAELPQGIPVPSPHPSQRPSWVEQEVLGFGVKDEKAKTCASQTSLASLHHANLVVQDS